MKLVLRSVSAISSREEVIFSRKRFTIVRVPRVPPLSDQAEAFVALRHELGLTERTAASALGIRKLDEYQALERGELEPNAADGWAKASEALRDAHARAVPEPAAAW